MLVVNILRGLSVDPKTGKVTVQPQGHLSPNNLVVLEELSKAKILDSLTMTIRQPALYALAEASALPLSDEGQRVGSADMITVVEWAESRGIWLDKAAKHKLASAAARAYRAKYGKPPGTVYRVAKDGRWNIRATGYEYKDIDILETTAIALRLLKPSKV